MNVKDCMSQKCQTISKTTTLKEAAEKMREDDIGFLPIVEDDRMIGMITDRDIVVKCVAEGCDPEEETVAKAMTHKTLYCYDDQSIEAVAKNMGEVQVRRMPVVNRDKRLVGIISLGDLSQASEKKAGEATQNITQELAHKRAA